MVELGKCKIMFQTCFIRINFVRMKFYLLGMLLLCQAHWIIF